MPGFPCSFSVRHRVACTLTRSAASYLLGACCRPYLKLICCRSGHALTSVPCFLREWLDALRPQHPENLDDDNLQAVPTAELPDRLAEQVAYGPGGLRGLLSSPYVFVASFLASLGGFSFGYDQGVISIINVMPQFQAQYPETASGGFYTGFMTATLEFGAFLGCFFIPKLADKVSRKWALSIVVVIFDVGAIIQTAAPNYGTLVAGRTIGGIGVGTLALVGCLFDSFVIHQPDPCTNHMQGRAALHL